MNTIKVPRLSKKSFDKMFKELIEIDQKLYPVIPTAEKVEKEYLEDFYLKKEEVVNNQPTGWTLEREIYRIETIIKIENLDPKVKGFQQWYCQDKKNHFGYTINFPYKIFPTKNKIKLPLDLISHRVAKVLINNYLQSTCKVNLYGLGFVIKPNTVLLTQLIVFETAHQKKIIDNVKSKLKCLKLEKIKLSKIPFIDDF